MSDDTATDNEHDSATQDDESSSSSGSMTGALPDADDVSQEELDESEAERKELLATREFLAAGWPAPG